MALGIGRAEAEALVRVHASSRPVDREPALVGCCLSPGWSGGLSWEGHTNWPIDGDADTGALGLVSVAVIREQRYDKVSVCGFLVDTHCLGVKNAVGPRVLERWELADFLSVYFGSYGAPPVSAPLDLVEHLVLGAVDFARALGFDPHPDFERCRAHLGSPTGASPIRFGCDGLPVYVEGPHDDVPQILSTLDRSVGRGNYEFVSVTSRF